MAEIRCKNCGAKLENFTGVGAFKCDYCGMINDCAEELSEDVMYALGKKESAYFQCKERMKKAKTSKEYVAISNILSRILDYKDSQKLLAVCKEKEQELSKTERKIKTVRLIALISVAVLILASVICFKIHKKNKYDVNKIEFEITEMRSEYKQGSSIYVNGEYYVYFTYKIKNGAGVGVDYVEFTTEVVDESGKTLGTINSRLGNYDSLFIEKKATKIQEIYISETRPENDSFFSALYGADIKDFKLEVRVTNVKFSDGKRYTDGKLYDF